MKISRFGAKDCVTGSCHLVKTRPGSPDGVSILVDCGTATDDDPVLSFARFPVLTDKIDYLFLTHAHIDHIGRVPDLIDAGFRDKIICTHATRALLLPMLRDALTFSSRTDEAVRCMETLIDELSWGFELCETFTLNQGITFKLSDAGQILGSCFILFTFPEEQGNDYREILSGDLGCTDTPIPPDNCDMLIPEYTYGDRIQPCRKNRVEVSQKVFQKALDDNGIVYLTAFSLGKTLELLYELDRICVKVSMFVDSPLGLVIIKAYTNLSAFCGKKTSDINHKYDNPFDFNKPCAVKKCQDHKGLQGINGLRHYAADSSICTGGG